MTFGEKTRAALAGLLGLLVLSCVLAGAATTAHAQGNIDFAKL